MRLRHAQLGGPRAQLRAGAFVSTSGDPVRGMSEWNNGHTCWLCRDCNKFLSYGHLHSKTHKSKLWNRLVAADHTRAVPMTTSMVAAPAPPAPPVPAAPGLPAPTPLALALPAPAPAVPANASAASVAFGPAANAAAFPGSDAGNATEAVTALRLRVASLEGFQAEAVRDLLQLRQVVERLEQELQAVRAVVVNVQTGQATVESNVERRSADVTQAFHAVRASVVEAVVALHTTPATVQDQLEQHKAEVNQQVQEIRGATQQTQQNRTQPTTEWQGTVWQGRTWRS
jgi:hypothetical protein